MIQIIVQAQKASCRKSSGERITTGMVGKKVTFDFSSEWDGLVKTAVFEGNGVTKDVALSGDTAVIPHECLTAPGGMLRVGVYGTDGTTQTPTIYTDIGQIEQGADPSGDESVDPTLPIWAQLQAMIGDLSNLTTTARDNLVAAINEAARTGGSGGGGESGGEEPTSYTVKNQMTNASTNNTIPRVSAGASYTSKLTAADGYVISAVTVTMGGTDITATAWDAETSKVTIASVTGDVVITCTGAAQSSGLTTEQVNALDGLFAIAAYTADPASAYSAFKVAFGLDGGTGEPDNPDITLTSISATYSGGDVAAGTALSDLTGIVVTAQYSDGSTATVTGYTLSGEITEGSNTITVTYQDKTTTFSVTGTAVSQVYTVTNNLTNVTNSNSATSVEAGGSYNATLTVADGCELASLTITMGGVDITDDVYGEGYILITDVTGDIVITAAAAVPEYVDMATGISTDTVKLYSDSGGTALATKYYQTGAYSLNRTETDAVVKVRLTNNTDSAISSSNVYIGSTDAQAIRNPNSSINVHYAISGSKGSVAAGASVEIEYTVRAGYWLYVCGYGSLDVSVVGALDVHEPTDVLETTSKAIDFFSVYSDAGTTLVEKGTYRTAYATTEAFDVDTPIRLTVVSGGANNGNILYGCAESGTLTANVNAHYGASAVVKNFATGAALIIDYTVKSGYYFAVLPCSGATIYIEKA